MFRVTHSQTRPSITVPFYYEIMPIDERQMLDTIVATSQFLISFDRITSADNLAVTTIIVALDEAARRAYYTQNKPFLVKYVTDLLAYNIANGIIDVYTNVTD